MEKEKTLESNDAKGKDVSPLFTLLLFNNDMALFRGCFLPGDKLMKKKKKKTKAKERRKKTLQMSWKILCLPNLIQINDSLSGNFGFTRCSKTVLVFALITNTISVSERQYSVNWNSLEGRSWNGRKRRITD
uniref:Uncharacterized protein n=1 Tax=Octopus bimaculoides TaxID=37653 RepID=A0A0L8GIS5_OCTBM